MRRRIRLTTRRELTAAIRQRYQAADRVGKKMILDEFTQRNGYNRKHAIRVLTTQAASEPKTRAVRRVYLHGGTTRCTTLPCSSACSMGSACQRRWRFVGAISATASSRSSDS